LHCFVKVATLKQNTEFVSAKARQRIAPAYLGFEQCSQLTEQSIARAVTTGIIDDFELVEIQVTKGVRGFACLGTL
jgi:hypothetical protein